MLALAFVLCCGAATARIVPGRGMAGVQIGDRMPAVRHTLGKPRRVVPPSWVYGLPLKGQVGFAGRRVDDIWTRSRRQRTKRGIGPGSTLRMTKRAYPKLRCHHRSGAWNVLCVLHHLAKHGRVDTDFLFKRNRVAIVDVFGVRRSKKGGPF
jgi:hypothetical protein